MQGAAQHIEHRRYEDFDSRWRQCETGQLTTGNSIPKPGWRSLQKIKNSDPLIPNLIVVRLAGVEPATLRLGGECSIH